MQKIKIKRQKQMQFNVNVLFVVMNRKQKLIRLEINLLSDSFIVKRFRANKFIIFQSKRKFFSNNLRIMKSIEHYSFNTFDTIGKGYSSQVYKGKNDTTSQEVAIKLIDLKFIKGELHKKLLQNEIAILKQLKHQQNVIRIYDVYNTKNNIYIITELCNEDLSKSIKHKKTFTQNQALSVLKQIISGYKAIYNHDIVHRDLKPANIFISSSTVKIADFGFAVKQSDLKKRQNYNVGSPVYMPYEALHDNIYSFKSDIWAIGVIFYEMLTGRTPWRAKTENDLKKLLKTSSIKSLIPPKISKISEQFLIKSLAFEPQNRMSAEQILRFFDRQSSDLDLGIEPRKMFSTPTGSSFRTRAVSQDTNTKNLNGNEYLLNNNISGPKTYKKINILKGVGQQTTYEAKFLKTRATIKQKDSNDGSFTDIDPKKISNQLVSQLHLCRFLFKLIERIDKNEMIDQSHNLRNQMSKIIFKRLGQIKNLTLLESEVAIEFRNFPEFTKLHKICDQYQQKYTKNLSPNLLIQHASAAIDQILHQQIRAIYSYIIQYQQNPQQVRDEVILLDYLITLKQLLSLSEKASIQQFHRKSKIQDIVEGKPTNNITKQHINAINTKIRAMRII